MEARTVLGVLGGRVGRSEGDAEVPELGVPEALRRRLGAELDAEQRWAALVDHPALVMLAAAGAGKTRTLTARVEALVASGVRPSAVVVTTFTRKAAEELGERLEARGVSGVLAGTFHGLCLRWLRASGHVLAADGVLLGDEVRSRAVLEGVLRERGLSGGEAVERQVGQTATRLSNRCVGPGVRGAERHAAAGPLASGEAVAVAWAWQRARMAVGAPDFDALQHAVLEGLCGGCGRLDAALGEVAHLLVDEAQDLSPLQARIVDALQARGSRVALVGDDDQAIYGFRASDPSFLVSRARDADWHVVRLGTNYRSTGRIVGAADRLVARNRLRAGKVVRASRGSGVRVSHRAFGSLREEAAAVARRGVALRGSSAGGGAPLAVLLRNNAQLGPYELACASAGLGVSRLGLEGVALLERPGLEWVGAWVRWALDGADGEALVAIRGLEERTRGGRGWRGLGERRMRLSQGLAAGWSASRWLWVLLDESGEDGPGWRSRAVDEEGRAALAMLEALARGRTGRWLVREGLRPLAGAPDVVLGTIHRSKGREWPVVWLPQVQEGVLPSRSAAGDAALLEEERRVAYVAWTRAADALVVSWVPLRGERSRFVRESVGWWSRWSLP